MAVKNERVIATYINASHRTHVLEFHSQKYVIYLIILKMLKFNFF